MDMYGDHMDGPQYSAKVAAAVSAAIDTAGQTQVAVAEATGIPRTTLIRRLAGVTPFTVFELAQIAAFLDMSVESLMAIEVPAA